MSEFHELRGDYVANAGQQINLHGTLDYFEPLGSALSRLPDGAGGPFVYHFTSGGRTVGSLGWVVSAASKRFGGWKLWGMWTEQPMPAIALPLFWKELADPKRLPDVVARANDEGAHLFDRRHWKSLARHVDPARLRDGAFRELLKAELARAYALPLPHRQPVEVELTQPLLDLLPWLYILGPVDPPSAQIRPSRFNDVGYQYILISDVKAREAAIPREVDELVDTAARDVAEGWALANALRKRRAQPKSAPPRRVREEREIEEEDEMPRKIPPPPAPPWMFIVPLALQLVTLALLLWVGVNVQAIRHAVEAQQPTTTTVDDGGLKPAAPQAAPVPEPQPAVDTAPPQETAQQRLTRIARALADNPPPGVRVSASLADTTDALSRAAVEVFLRRNACFRGTDPVDGKLSAAEQRAVRSCTALHEARLATSNGQIDAARAIAWLERLVS